MKVFLSIVGCIFKCSLNLEHSEKKQECPSLIITEINASVRDLYLSV